MDSSSSPRITNAAIPLRDQSIPGWYWSHNQFIDDHAPRLGVYAVAVYHLLCRQARGNRIEGWGLARMAEALNCGRTKVSESVRRLEEYNVIARLKRAGGETEYVLLDLTGSAPSCNVNVCSDPSTDRMGGVRNADRGRSPYERPIRKEKLQDSKTKQDERGDIAMRRGTAPEPSIELPPWIPIDSWNGFVEMRKTIRRPLTSHGAKLLIAKLEQFRQDGHDPVEILNESTMNDWQGVFLPRYGGNDGARKTAREVRIDQAREYLREVARRKNI